MDLLEREPQLSALTRYLDDAIRGHGRTVFVSGEAGAGKTQLVSSFAGQLTDAVRVLLGECDGGASPRPLGPLADVAAALGSVEGFLAGEPSRDQLFRGALDELAARPTVLVIEDVHWADEATLDLIRFLGRRVKAIPVLLVATFRDDEVGGQHPLTAVLGDLATRDGTTRMHVPPLTLDAVARLADGSGIDAGVLYERTGGNPFYVTETLAAGRVGLPPSVRDAVLARAGRLSADARRALRAAAVIGTRVEASLVLDVSGVSIEALDECFDRGMLVREGTLVSFRHEVARAAIERDVAAGALAGLHAATLAALFRRGNQDHRRLADHAAAAGDADAVVRHAPKAAVRAAALGAHREAAAHYRRALRVGGRLSDGERAELLERLSYECYLTNAADESLQTRRGALELRRVLGDGLRVGQNLRWLSRLSWFVGRNVDAGVYALAAVDALERLEAGPELAMAYSNVSQLRMLSHDYDEGVRWGTRAIDLAERLEERGVLSHALNNVGTSLLLSGDQSGGTSHLQRSLDIALSIDAHEHAARAYTNLGSAHITNRRFTQADLVLEAGITYSEDRDLDSWRFYMEALRSQSWLELGRLARAREGSDAVLRQPLAPPTRIVALVVSATASIRCRGEEAEALLREATELAQRTDELQRLVPVACARAESAWTAGRADQIAREVGPTWEAALANGTPWDVGELAWWMYKGGAIERAPGKASPPFALMIDGRAGEAAALWEVIDAPFWRALALAETGETDGARLGIGLLRSIGADETVRAVARDLRSRGIRPPRGPRRDTIEHPHGLTSREVEVLALLADGQSNVEIAEHLVVSEKTVGHHVSAILRKLRAPSRARAGAEARRLGIGPPTESSGQDLSTASAR